MIEAQVEGIYQTDVGSGQKQFTNYNFTIDVAGNHLDFLDSHLQKRFVPIKIRQQKGKPMFSRLTNYRLVSYKVNDKPCGLDDKDIFEMNEWEIQQLARFFNLLEIPLPYTISLHELKERAALEYLKHVIKVPMETNEDKDKLEFFVKQESGGYVVNFENQKCNVKAVERNLDASIPTPSRLSLEEILHKSSVQDNAGFIPSESELLDI